MKEAPEFSRTRRLDQFGETPQSIAIHAEPAERAALAKRFALIAVDDLRADFNLSRQGETVRLTGSVHGAVKQACVATGEPVAAKINESVELRFLPQPDSHEEEVEIDSDEVDTVFYSRAEIDLGEAAAETLALALDPFPRSKHADAVLKEAGVLSEEEAGPFGALAGLRDKLSGKG